MVFEKISKGEIPPSEGLILLRALHFRNEIVEVAELTKRVEKLLENNNNGTSIRPYPTTMNQDAKY